MKKVLIMNDLEPLVMREKGFFNRSGVSVFTAATNDDCLKIHIEEKVNLIVAGLGAPGISSETMFDIIRQGEGLRHVSILMVCEDTAGHRERCIRCGANAVLPKPVDPAQFKQTMQRLLDIAPRHAYRVALSVAVEGKYRSKPLLYRTQNISASGMLIEAAEDLASGDLISASFFLPDGTRVCAHGEIIRAVKQAADADSPRRYGVKFTDILPHVQSAIEEFVRRD